MSEPVTPALLRAMPLPRHDSDADKEARGRVLAIGGSAEVPGGILLAGLGALRAGAGKLQIATVESRAAALGIAVPEARVFALPETADGDIASCDGLAERAHGCAAIVIGPGMLDTDAARNVAQSLLGCGDSPAFLLDAAVLSGLRDLSELCRKRDGRLVLTPHAGEMAKLLAVDIAEVEADSPACARRAAEELNAVVALKGGATHIAAPDGRAWTWTGGSVGLATSGSGDTLAGVAAGLLARGAAPEVAAIWAVFLHGEAGNRLAARRGPLGFLARELLAEVPALMAEYG